MKVETMQAGKGGRTSFVIVATIFAVLLIAMLALIPFSGWISSFRLYDLPGSSMEPTLFKGDHIVVNERYYQKHPLKDGDIVTFRHGDNVLVKRVCALPGESMEGKKGVLFRNGKPLNEPYAQQSKENPIPELETFEYRVIPKEQIFVVGDSRDASLDSRSTEFGSVLMSDVLGKVVYIYMSSHRGQTGRSF